jgi:hypothetical protein
MLERRSLGAAAAELDSWMAAVLDRTDCVGAECDGSASTGSRSVGAVSI